MSVRTQLLASTLMLAAIALADAAGQNKGPTAYRWVDDKGVVHYGDSIPPEYARKETSVLNRQGVEVGRNAAQKSPEQLAEDARREAALSRQRQHDNFLLTTYTSVRDIEELRDQRLDQLKGQRVAAEQYIDGLQSRLTGLQTRAMMFKPYSTKPNAHRMPDDLAEDLVRTLNEMNTQRKALTAKAREENALRAQFDADIERYRELRTASARR